MLVHGSPANPTATSRIGISINYISPRCCGQAGPESPRNPRTRPWSLWPFRVVWWTC